MGCPCAQVVAWMWGAGAALVTEGARVMLKVNLQNYGRPMQQSLLCLVLMNQGTAG